MKRRPRHKKRRGWSWWRLESDVSRLPSPQHVRRGSRVRGMKWRVFKRKWARKLSRFKANTRRLQGEHDMWRSFVDRSYITDRKRRLHLTELLALTYTPLPPAPLYPAEVRAVSVDSSSAPGFAPTPKESP